MFHIKKDGLPGKCTAQAGNCPLGGADDHYTTQLEAIVAAEKKLLAENDDYLEGNKKSPVYHIGENGAVEECPFRSGYCSVKPYGKFNNKHSTDKAIAEGNARAFREIQAKDSPASTRPKPATPAPRPKVAADPITNEARKLRGDIYDSYQKDGWTEEEIQKSRDSCGHWRPARFSPPSRGYSC